MGSPGINREVGTGRSEDEVLDLGGVALCAVEGIRARGTVRDPEDNEPAPRGAVGEAAGSLDQHVVRFLVRIARGCVDRVLLEVEDGRLQIVGDGTVEDAVERLGDVPGEGALTIHCH
jgi:hypothetical protein